jgi:hypothetical protein
MILQILSFSPADRGMLAPAPNVNEAEYIDDILKKDETPTITNLDGVRLTVLTSHRGTNLYCAGGVTVYRMSPTSFGGNGFYSMPPLGTEETVEFSTAGGRFRGQVIFCSDDV